MTTMADLGDGAQVRHIEWNSTGTIRVTGSVTAVAWGEYAAMEVSDEGPVFPSDLEIIGEAS